MRGKRQDAERELAKLVGTMHSGTFVEASKTTVAEHLRAWLDGAHGLAGKTVERYRELAEQQIIPHIGGITLQKLRPAHVADWHCKAVDGRRRGWEAIIGNERSATPIAFCIVRSLVRSQPS